MQNFEDYIKSECERRPVSTVACRKPHEYAGKPKRRQYPKCATKATVSRRFMASAKIGEYRADFLYELAENHSKSKKHEVEVVERQGFVFVNIVNIESEK